MASSSNTRKQALRSRILSNHMQRLSLSHHNDALETALRNQAFDDSWPSEQATSLPGGLTRDDLLRFETLPTVHDAIPFELEDPIAEELDSTFRLFCDVFYAPLEDGEDVEHSPTQLLQDVITLKAASSDARNKVEEQRKRILTLVAQINEIHPRLESHLLKALSSSAIDTNTHTPTNIPSKSNAQLTSRANLLATSIDTALLRLQLLRARFEESLYDFSAPPSKSKSGTSSATHSVVSKGSHTKGMGQSRTFAEALQSSSQKLSEEEARLAAEEEELDRRLAEYEDLLDIVDRDRGTRKRTNSAREDGRRNKRSERGNDTFGQVVDDWARVKKETEECVRDLRRLGWTEG